MNPFNLAGSGGASSGSGTGTAANTSFVSNDSIEATNVQDAIEELDSDILNNILWNIDGDGNIVPIDTGGTIEGNAFGDLVVDTADFSTASYVVNWGLSDVTTQLNITSSTTLADITGLLQTGLLAGKRYKIEAILFVSNTANTGAKFAFLNADSLSVTSFIAIADSYSSTGSLVAHNKVTTLTGSLCAATAVIERVEIKGMIVVNTGGTLKLQAAQNASHADTLSILTGSHMTVTQMEL